jgi:serine/threonine protein kinase
MITQLSSTLFLQFLGLSGLLTSEQMAIVDERFPSPTNESSADVSAQNIMIWLLKRKLITPWHAEKLIQGRFRGFFLGNYKLLNRVAKGGMSTIYAAEDQQSHAVHALKVLPLSKTNKASYLQRFQREAAITQRLNHPNIVRVFGIFSGTDGQADVHFMAMELLEGRDLFDTVNADGPMACRTAVEYIRQAALGLEYAHQAGLVHRDIKPGNLFLSIDQTVRILDLGLAQDFDSEENLTREFNERVLGTADYLSPEQAADSHTVDKRADIYSLGCSLYFLLTGQPPFTEGTLVQRLIAHQTKTPPVISEFRSDVPEELIEILLQMMAKNRSDRTATAGEVANRLGSFLNTTAHRPELNVKPIILKHPTTASAGSVCEIHSASSIDNKQEDRGLKKSNVNQRLTSLSSTTPLRISPSTDRFLPEFETLLKRIESDCDVKGSLHRDSRSARLLAFSKELQQPPEVIEPTPDFSSIEAMVPLKWPAEDTVLNDITPINFSFDPKAFAPQLEKEAASKLMIDELLAAMELDDSQPKNDSGVPLLKTTALASRTVNTRQSKRSAKRPAINWLIAAIVAAAALIAIVWLVLK